MFVVTEADIKENVENRYECSNIVIPDDLLLQYIVIFFYSLTTADSVEIIIDTNRCFFNNTFRVALKTYMKQLTRVEIRNLIQTGGTDFVKTLFVMTEDDIEENTDNRYGCFGIVITDVRAVHSEVV